MVTVDSPVGVVIVSGVDSDGVDSDEVDGVDGVDGVVIVDSSVGVVTELDSSVDTVSSKNLLNEKLNP